MGKTSDGRIAFAKAPDGGNAIDAAVTTGLIAAVMAPNQTGIGGFGMSAIVATDGGKRIVAIDGNSTAPQSMARDYFDPSRKSAIPARQHQTGWLSAGVPGVLAGLQLLLDQFGTQKLGSVIRPAIRIARDGFPWPEAFNRTLNAQPLFKSDPGSKRLYFPDGVPPRGGEPFRNLDLAAMLETLANADSVDAFYRGDIAQRIAEGFEANHGLVSAEDLATYRAELVQPTTLTLDGWTICTAPLTFGGVSTLQMLHALHAMDWKAIKDPLQRTHAKVEVARLAWRDRVTLLGDPKHVDAPVERLLSAPYAKESAERIRLAVSDKSILDYPVVPKRQPGTIHISSADSDGNFVALTLTHGQSFGACVTVDGLGLTLGHGMSRFDTAADHPNSPGPGKKPLNNMTPTIVSRDGKVELAIGGAGGRKIPNALYEILCGYVLEGKSLNDAFVAPRMHTEGSREVALTRTWPENERDYLKSLGYTVSTENSASMSAAAIVSGELTAR